MSFDDGLILGLMLGEGNSGGDEPTEDWQPPADWLTVPKPAENDIYILIEAVDDITKVVYLFFFYPEVMNTRFGQVVVDWGDGSIDTYSSSDTGNISAQPTHTYEILGQFLIKITTEIGLNNCFGYSCESPGNVLMCKTGSKIVFSTNDYPYSTLNMGKRMEYFKHFGSANAVTSNFASTWWGVVKVEFGTPLINVPSGAFGNCYSLRILDTSEILSIGDNAFRFSSALPAEFPKCKSIERHAFSGCYLRKINFPECEKIGDYAFRYCQVQKINIPKCKEIGSGAFMNCTILSSVNAPSCEIIKDSAFSDNYSLTDITVSDNCTFGSNCFNNCYKLYPRPDGSTN